MITKKSIGLSVLALTLAFSLPAYAQGVANVQPQASHPGMQPMTPPTAGMEQKGPMHPEFREEMEKIHQEREDLFKEKEKLHQREVALHEREKALHEKMEAMHKERQEHREERREEMKEGGQNHMMGPTGGMGQPAAK